MEVKVEGLKKYFGKTKAVDDITFGFGQGQVVGFVGPNGAGKTTTMRIMATIDGPTAGDVSIDGVSVVEYPEQGRCKMGFMPDFLPMHDDMTVDDYLDFFARAFGIRHKNRQSVVQCIEEFAGLRGIKDKYLKSLSKGMKQRVSLARSIVHDPSVLILDEPASGLDPRARIELRELLKELSHQGKAILVSSHILTELAEICDSAVIIEHGKLLQAGTISELATAKSHFSFHIRTIGDKEKLYKYIVQRPLVINTVQLPDGVEVDYDGKEGDIARFLREITESGFEVIEFRHLKTGLEDVFMNITKGELA